MFRNKKEIFSIRKTVLGVGSVLLGVMLTTTIVDADQVAAQDITSGSEAAISTVVPSESVTLAATTDTTATATTDTTTTTAVDTTTADLSAPIVTETIIASPIRYVEDPSQPVGFKAVTSQGTDGKLVYTTLNGQTTVERIEPTETVITLGTQATSTVVATMPADTTYSLDYTKAYGDDVIIAGKDGQTVETTDYKISTTSTMPVSPQVTSEGYKWIDQNFYHIDMTQLAPSERVQIDQLFVEIPPLTSDYTLTESTIREIDQYWGPVVQLTETITNPDGTTSQQVVTRQITSDMLDPNNTALREALGLTSDAAYYSTLLEASRQDLWVTSANLLSMAIVPEDLSLTTDDFLRYANSNVVTDALYADIKADYLRAKAAYEGLQTLGVLTTTQQNYMPLIENQFESLTIRYNSYHDLVKPTVDYSHTGLMTDTQKIDFENRIQALPIEMQRIISEIIIYDGSIPGTTASTIGLSNSADLSISLKFDYSNPNLIKTLIHELTHIIDFKSGMYNETIDRNTDGKLSKVISFSDSQEFLDVYHTYFDRADVWYYYRDYNQEAFAEGLSQYIMHTFYGVPYTKYTISPFTGQAYQTSGPGYSPFEASEFYFASLYNRLFEQTRTAEVIPYIISTETSAPITNQVIFGAMPEESVTTIPYHTIYVSDPTMAYDPTGQTDIISMGSEGTIVTARTYALDGNNQLVATDTIVSTTDPIDQIIIKGTKSVSTDTLVAKTVSYQESTDSNMADWQVVVASSGQDGLIRTVVTYTMDPSTGMISSTSSESTVTEMIPMLIQYKVGSPIVTTIPFTTRYVADDALPIGTQKVVSEGITGSSTETIQSYDFIESGADSNFTNIIYSSPAVVEAQDQIIAVGTKLEVTEKTIAKTVIYQEVTDATLTDWEVRVAQAGQDGILRKTVTYTVNPDTGVVTPFISETILLEMTPMIVNYKVGTTRESVIPYTTKYIEDNTLPKGHQLLITKGVNGFSQERLVSYDFIQAGSISYFANIVYETPEITAASDEVIAIGTFEKPKSNVTKGYASKAVVKQKQYVKPKPQVPAVVKKQVNKRLPIASDSQNSLVSMALGITLVSGAVVLRKKPN